MDWGRPSNLFEKVLRNEQDKQFYRGALLLKKIINNKKKKKHDDLRARIIYIYIQVKHDCKYAISSVENNS